MSQVSNFYTPTRIVSGLKAVDALGEHITCLGTKRALIVTDPVMQKNGLVSKIQGGLAQFNVCCDVFDGIISEPLDTYIVNGLYRFQQSNADTIIGLGGGSALDTAKGISILATNAGKVSDYAGAEKVINVCPPIVAIPTTAGTGSEVTPYTIITDTGTNVKMLIASQKIIPRLAILDPVLTITMPPQLTAATGIDALTHAIEAYVSRKSQPLTEPYALASIALIFRYLLRAYLDGSDLEARSQMLNASLMAGIAFANSSVALVHGMARPLGAHFHLSHGVAVASLLTTITEFSLVGNPERYANIANTIGIGTSANPTSEILKEFVWATEELIKQVQVPTIKQLGVDKNQYDQLMETMAIEAIESGSPNNNPRVAKVNEIIELYQQCYQ